MRKLYLLILSFLFIPAAASQEQTEKKFDLYVYSGFAYPNQPSEFSDLWRRGWTIGGAFGASLYQTVSVNVSADYSTLEINPEALLKSVGLGGYRLKVNGGSTSILALLVNAKAFLTSAPSAVVPYVTVGMGYTYFSTADVIISYDIFSTYGEGASESALGLTLGGGIEIPIGPSALYIEGRHNIGYTEAKNTIYSALRAGFRIKV